MQAEEAQEVASGVTEAEQPVPVAGASTDVAEDVARELKDHTSDPQIPADTVRQEAPAAVAEEVAEHKEKVETTASLEELRKAQDERNAAANAKQAEEKKAVLDQIKQVADTYKVSLQEIVDHFGGLKKPKQVRGKVAPKYRNPEDGSTWTGRGKAPLWIKDQDRTKFLITE